MVDDPWSAVELRAAAMSSRVNRTREMLSFYVLPGLTGRIRHVSRAVQVRRSCSSVIAIS